MKFWTVTKTDPERVLSYVHNNEAGALAIGQVCEWDLTAETDVVAGRSVESADGAATPLVAGVVWGTKLNGTGAPADQEYFWLQIYGYHPAVLTDGTITAGDALIAAADGTADAGTVGTNDGAFFGIALSTDGGSPTTSDAIIRCM